MRTFISTEKKPIKLWLEDIEDGALEQAKNLANLPFVFKHIAIMPDAHFGYGMPIGGVMATIDVIIPNAVGVDIGCGMSAVKTSLEEIDTDSLKKIMGKIRQGVPVGYKKHKDSNYDNMPAFSPIEDVFERKSDSIIYKEWDNAAKSLGTLGGGNHFIEIQKGSDGFVWIMVHSGSRNLGKKVADHYNKIAIENNERWFSEVKSEKQLAFLPLDTEFGNKYWYEMNCCVDFALQNRKVMMDIICNIFKELTSCAFLPCINGDNSKLINIAHNYAIMENHFGVNVMIHRKGATLARENTIGIIPGSQGTKSYIVGGLGNPDSFHSCSHGAGRKMGRKQAQRILDLEVEKKRLDDLGVIHSVRGIDDLDEAAGAYKDISVVMENQIDLVDIKVELTPLAVIKG